MSHATAIPRQLTMSDLTWVLDLASVRRERITPFAPRFWKPAPKGRELHAAFLSSLIDSPEVISVRTDKGFLFGMPHNDLVLVDDMALQDDSDWPTDGRVLLRWASETGPLRFVCPVPEEPRTSTASAVGLVNVESWWHRNLEPGAAAQRGACVSVVTHQPRDEQLAELLTSAGYKRTTDYYEGTPSA